MPPGSPPGLFIVDENDDMKGQKALRNFVLFLMVKMYYMKTEIKKGK